MLGRSWAPALYRLRHGRRTGVSRAVLIVLIVALTAGGVIAALSGARRSAHAYGRLLAWTNSPDVSFSCFSCTADQLDEEFDRIRASPIVADSTRAGYATVVVELPDGARPSFLALLPIVDLDNRAGRELPRLKMLHGRLPRTDDPKEATIGFVAAERFDLHVGDVVQLIDGADGVTRLESVDIVGIHAAPGELPSATGAGGSTLILPQAFVRTFPAVVHPADAALLVRLRPGTSAVDRAALYDSLRFGLDYDEAALVTSGVQRTVRVETVALIVLACVIGFAGLVMTGQMLRRRVDAQADERLVVSALGWTRRDTSRLALLDGLAIGGAGAVLGVLFAVALSPIFPIGIARVADPDIGWHLDWQLVTVALAATVILVAALSMLVSVGRVRAHRGRASAVTTAGPRIVRARPDVMTGLSFNRLSQGRGERPAALFSLITCVGVVALLSASGVLLASLDHLVAHRELAGATWQAVMLPTFDLSEEGLARGLDTVRHVPGVAAAGRGGWASSGGVYDGRVVVNGVPVEGQIFDDTGEIRPAIRRGRAPMSAGEVALGAKEMRALDVDIGDAVTVSAEVGGATIQGRVVGEAVLASPYFVTFPPGTGAATVLSTFAEVGALQPETAPFVFVRYADDADPLHTFDSIETALGNSEGFEAADRQGSTGLDRIRAVPELLIVGLLALIAVALAHVLLVSVRRHRRDLAVLSTLGFTHRQTWLAVVVQGAEIALLVCALGVPIGVVAGRITWDRIADGFYVVARPIAPVLFLLGLVLALLAVASLAALLPAARAMRLRPAQILRSDFA